jgi:hypothetical protein
MGLVRGRAILLAEVTSDNLIDGMARCADINPNQLAVVEQEPNATI